MNKIVRIINKTGIPSDTEVFIGKKKIPLSHLLRVDIRIDPEDTRAYIELQVDELDIIANLQEGSK